MNFQDFLSDQEMKLHCCSVHPRHCACYPDKGRSFGCVIVCLADTNLYLNHALCFVPDNKLYSCQEIMQQHGFWDLLSARKDPPDKKAGRVQALASLGLVASLCDRSEISCWHY